MQSSTYAGWPVRSCGDARHPFTTAPAKGGLPIHATVRNAVRFLIRRLDLRLLALLVLLAPVMQAPAQTATPTVTRVSFASSPGSGDAYTRNEVISVRVRFSRAVTLGGRTSINYQTSFDESGFPYVGLTIGGSTRQAVYSHGSGTTALIFSYTVQAGDSDDDGISIAANALRRNGASLVATADDTVEAALSHGALGPDSSRKVDSSEATRPVIVVEPQEYIAGEPIDPLVLPSAAMEDELSSYTLTPPLPDGLRLIFNDVGEPVVVGTPTAAAVRSTHTFTTVDEDGDTVTRTFTIEVERDLVPSYMGVASPEESVERGTEVRVTLPAAMGGNLPIEYSVDPPLPPGLRFDPNTRTIVGTLSTQTGTASGIGPRTASGFAVSQASRQEYTITAVDANGDVATLTFFITVEEEENNLPSFGTATIPDQEYRAESDIEPLTLPAATGGDGALSYTVTPALPGGLAFNAATRVLSGAPTTASAERSYTLTATDEDGDTVTLTFVISVAMNNRPSFGTATILDQEYRTESGIEPLTLPVATGGDGALAYTVTPALPGGLAFNAATRVLSGTPTTGSATRIYTLTATDEDGDAATLSFAISVATDNQPSFGAAATIPDQEYRAGSDIEPLTLPPATGGDGALRYMVTPALPGGLAFNAATRVLSGAPTTASAERSYTLTATDEDGDTATLSFAISVEADSQPSFGAATIPDQEYRAESDIEPLTLPAATGGDGALLYTVAPALPGGLAFDAATRILSGAPTTESAERRYALTATDEDGDAATLSFTVTVGEALAPVRGRALESALAGFGRTVATEAVSAISDRFGQTECRSQATLGGRTLTLDSLKGSVNLTSLEEELRYLDRLDYDEWRLSARDFLAGTAFNLSLGRNGLASGNASDPCSPWSVWGRGAFSEFESSDGTDGEVFTGYVGADLRMSSSMLLGVALSHSAGDMDYSLDATPAIPGEVDANLTSVLPYAHWSPIESMGLWGMLGVGWGETTMTDTLGKAETDVEMRMVAVGGHNDLIVAQSTTLAVKVDAFAVELETDEEEGLAKVKSDTERLRLMLESRSELSSTDASRLELSVEAGGRWDGGDADVGWGLEIGGGLNYRNTDAGLGMAARGRYLVTHRENNFEDWGASIAFSLDPGAPEEGMSLSLTPAWGNAVSQVDTLWQNPLTPGIGNFSSLRRQALDGRHPTARSWRPDSLELKLSYGLPTRSGMGMTKFYTALSESGLSNRAYRFGTRLTLSEWLKLTFELHRQERNLSDDAPEYGARVGLSLRYW